MTGFGFFWQINSYCWVSFCSIAKGTSNKTLYIKKEKAVPA
jgi:hypothetical protein